MPFLAANRIVRKLKHSAADSRLVFEKLGLCFGWIPNVSRGASSRILSCGYLVFYEIQLADQP